MKLAQFGKALDKLKPAANSAGYAVDAKADLLTTIGNIIKTLIGLTGVIFVILLIYAGFLWMTAGGDSKKVDKSKNIIRNCIIGLVIIVLAYAITSFIFTRLGQVTTTN